MKTEHYMALNYSCNPNDQYIIPELKTNNTSKEYIYLPWHKKTINHFQFYSSILQTSNVEHASHTHCLRLMASESWNDIMARWVVRVMDGALNSSANEQDEIGKEVSRKALGEAATVLENRFLELPLERELPIERRDWTSNTVGVVCVDGGGAVSCACKPLVGVDLITLLVAIYAALGHSFGLGRFEFCILTPLDRLVTDKVLQHHHAQIAN